MKYGYWNHDNLIDTNYNVEPFFEWVGYKSGFTDGQYEVNKDTFGPFYFMPIQCLEVNSF